MRRINKKNIVAKRTISNIDHGDEEKAIRQMIPYPPYKQGNMINVKASSLEQERSENLFVSREESFKMKEIEMESRSIPIIESMQTK